MLVLGLMSGTSADAIDVALARISGAAPHLNAKLLKHTSIKFPSPLRKEILRVAEQQAISAGALRQLHFRLRATLAAAPSRHQVPPSAPAPAPTLTAPQAARFPHTRRSYEKGAPLAQQARTTPALLDELMRDPYLNPAPPKSTGREYYGHAYLQR